MNPISRFGISFLTGLILAATAFAFPSTAVQYVPVGPKIIQQSLPLTPPATPDPVNPINPYTLTVISPIAISYPQTVTINFSIATAGNVAGGVKALPAGADPATALSYVSANPATLTFTGPTQSLTTIISVKIDPTQSRTAVTGDYGYVINTLGWPASVGGVTDPVTGGPVGSTINLTVNPAPPAPIPPTITNLLPVSGSNYIYDPQGGTVQTPFTISFDANAINGATTDKITSLSANLDGFKFDGIQTYSSGETMNALQSAGLQTISASATVVSPTIIGPGPHTITVAAYSASTPSVTTTTVINIHTPPSFTSASAATFAVGQPGSFQVMATGFSAPTLSLTGGTLPAGITFNAATGELSGTPTTATGSPITLTFTATNDVRAVDQNFQFTIKATPTINWLKPTAITYGTALSSAQLSGATATVGSSTVSGNFTYSPAVGTVLGAGTQTLNVTFNPDDTANYGSASGSVTLVVNPATLTVTAAGATRAYGAANPPFTATISGYVNGETAANAGVTGAAALTCSATRTSPVGNYTIAAGQGTLAATNYTFSFVSGTLSVSAAPLTVTALAASKTYGAADPASFGYSFSPALVGTDKFTGALTRVAGENVGTYAINQGTLSAGNNYTLTYKSALFTINPATQTITFGPLAPVTVGTAPFALTATGGASGNPLTYTSSDPTVASLSMSGSTTTVTVLKVGTTVITASQLGNRNYLAAASVTQTLTVNASTTPTCGTAIVRHAPTLNGNAGVDGSLQVLLPESNSLNGNVWISDRLLVPGTPTVKLNGHPTYGSIINGNGSASPSNYTVTLNGNVALGHLVRRTDAVAMPVIAAPPPTTNTRDLKLNKSSDSAGNFSTVRDLTVNGNVGSVAVPAGTYRDFTVNGNNGLVLGAAGATQPAVYNLRNLVLNGNSQLAIVGPVILNVSQNVTFNGDVGNSDHPEWLALNLYSGDLTLNGTVSLFGYVVAPAGDVTINGNGSLSGGLICDTLTMNGNGQLELCSDDDQSPGKSNGGSNCSQSGGP